MKTLFQFPRPLVRKILFTPLIGLACVGFSFVYWLSTRDRILLYLGILLALACLAKGVNTYRIALRKNYDIILGTCVGVSRPTVGKYHTIRIMDVEGLESSVKVSKQNRFVIGEKYRLYFKKSEGNVIAGIPQSLQATDMFLGYEAYDEFADSKEQ